MLEFRRLVAVATTILVVVGAACSDPSAESVAADEDRADEAVATADDGHGGEGTSDGGGPVGPRTEEDAGPEVTTDPEPDPEPVTVAGVVRSAVDGAPLGGATVSTEDAVMVTGPDGRFTLPVHSGRLTVERPVWRSTTVDLGAETDGAGGPEVAIELEPVVVRGLRVARDVAADADRFAELLALAEETTVNTLVFDTKDESTKVLYATEVEYAHRIGAVDAVYDPVELLALARERDLYAVTRIVTFEDGTWAGGDSEAKLAGSWVDAADEANWAYPLALAEEACSLGFDEIQFDYVRFPAGRTAEAAASQIPATSAERAAVIETFLGRARDLLHPRGCGVSAAIFGIVMSSETDEGIGQTPETVSGVVDAVSPMLYPSHYGPGWLGFDDPNDHPGPVIAHALDTGGPRMAPHALMRPWIQGFYYDGAQVRAQIDESEARGAGWIIWNFLGNYRRDWLPSA